MAKMSLKESIILKNILIGNFTRLPVHI